MRSALRRHLHHVVGHAVLRERSKNGGAPVFSQPVNLPAHVEPMSQRLAGSEREEAVYGFKVIVDTNGTAIGEQDRLIVNGVARQILQSVPVYDTDGSLSHYEVVA